MLCCPTTNQWNMQVLFLFRSRFLIGSTKSKTMFMFAELDSEEPVNEKFHIIGMLSPL